MRVEVTKGILVRKIACLCIAAVITFTLTACGKTLSGTYAMSTNHTVTFESNGTCVVEDNGVKLTGSYKFDSGNNAFNVTVNEPMGTVETFVFECRGDDLVSHENGYEFVYEKQ